MLINFVVFFSTGLYHLFEASISLMFSSWSYLMGTVWHFVYPHTLPLLAEFATPRTAILVIIPPFQRRAPYVIWSTIYPDDGCINRLGFGGSGFLYLVEEDADNCQHRDDCEYRCHFVLHVGVEKKSNNVNRDYAVERSARGILFLSESTRRYPLQ